LRPSRILGEFCVQKLLTAKVAENCRKGREEKRDTLKLTATLPLVLI